MTTSEILSLQNTLIEALDAYRAEIAAQNLPEPSLNTSRPHPIDHLTYLPTPVMFEARRAALACLGLLTALIRAPYDAIAVNAQSSFEPVSLQLAADLDLATIIGESEDGVSLTELAAKTGIEEARIERIFRCLITQGWFREPREGYFANNRMSNIIKSDQPGFHMATFTQKLYSKIAAYYPDMINHPDLEYRKKTDPSHCAFQMAYNTDLPYFGAVSWCSKKPEEATKFALSMEGISPRSDPGIAADFPWGEICKGKDALIDVGGGQGTLCCSLATRYPQIKQFIIQDLMDCREAAEANIKSKNLSDRVSFEVQDFFTPQKRKGKYVFVIQRVFHNWSTEDGAKILRQIRDVLNQDSNLLIIDALIGHAVTSNTGPSLKESLSKLDPNVYSPVPPPPFVPVDFGEANRFQNSLNAGLSALCNCYFSEASTPANFDFGVAFERTLPQMEEMVNKAGLKIKKIYATRGWMPITEVERA